MTEDRRHSDMDCAVWRGVSPRATIVAPISRRRARRVRDISSDEEPWIPSGRNVVPRLSSAEFVGDDSRYHSADSPSHFRGTRRGRQGFVSLNDSVEPTCVDPPDSPDLELLLGNSSTVPGFCHSRIDFHHWVRRPGRQQCFQ